jgi:hypothetical protein
VTSWVNRSAGVAARNGTTSHTVSFTGASSGSLLVVLMCGAVTNTMSTSGYTKQLGPINNTELSVWTKTAGAGENSLTVTHNASNYPCAYEVYEFPAGSTWAGGTSASNATTWPTLSGLTGTNSVFGALSEDHVSGDPAYSATWSSGWTSDVDSDTAFSTTDGIYHTVGFQDGYASSTATPSETDTSNRTDERAVFAIAVASAGTATFPPSFPTRRRPAVPRRLRPVQTPVRAQVNPPPTPAVNRAVRRRLTPPRRAEVAVVVPAQQAAAQTPPLTQRVTRERVQLLLTRLRQRGDTSPPQDQALPPAGRPAARRRLLPRREQNVTSPVPAQVVVTQSGYPPASPRGRRFSVPARRGRTPSLVPAQVVVTPPVYAPNLTKTRRAALPVRRGRSAGPVPAQVSVVAPPWVPVAVRGLRRVVATVRRTRPGVWLFGGTGVVGATDGFAWPGDGLGLRASPGDGTQSTTATGGDGTTIHSGG